MWPQSDPQPLEMWIRNRIVESGPITFAQFMEWALYHPLYGYYTTGPRLGPRGDFTTSPEASHAFGRLFAQHVREIDDLLSHPAPIEIVECGPGLGTLASDLLDTLKGEHPDLYGRLRYWLVDVSPALMATQREKVLPAHAPVAQWCGKLEDIPASIQGAVIANEVVDAFPVHILENRDGSILEQFVTVGTDGKLVLTYSLPSDPALLTFLDIESIVLAPGERIEINLAASAWLQQLSSILGKGIVTIIDYGDTAPQRYSAFRREGTLLGYFGGAVTDNVLANPGKQDLTALVDFTALQNAGMASGFAILGMTRQAHFLLGLGLGTTLTAESATDSVESAIQYRRGMQALISMEGLGRFHVLHLARNVDLQQAASLSALKYREF